MGLRSFLRRFRRWLLGERVAVRPSRPAARRPRPRVEPLEDRRLLAATLYVNDDAVGLNTGASWTDAYIDLQSALTAAAAGDEIWVAAGTYKPTATTDRSISFNLKESVSLYGGFAGTETARDQRDWTANVTTLSGDIGTIDTKTDNSYHVVYASSVTNAAVDGFAVTGGYADKDDEARGGGLCCTTSSLTLANLDVHDNAAINTKSVGRDNVPTAAGGGLFLTGAASTLKCVTFARNTVNNSGYSSVGAFPNAHGGGAFISSTASTFSQVTFVQNSAAATSGCGVAGGLYLASSSATLDGVTFDGNTVHSQGARGGGMYIEHCTATLTDVVFNANTSQEYGGGIASYLSPLTMKNVVFCDNVAGMEGGGLRASSGDATSELTNVTFVGNSAGGGGGMFTWDWDAILTNVVFRGNSVKAYGGGIINREASLTLVNVTFVKNVAQTQSALYDGPHYPGASNLTNCIAWGNGESPFYETGPTITNSIIEGGWAGEGNLDADPLFVDAANGDLRLRAGSPAIDAGTSDGAPSTDLAGNPRPLDGDGDGVAGVDMGAYEYNPNNAVPVAEAGGPYVVGVGQSVTLNGLGAFDPDGTVVRYEWDFDYDSATFDVDATGQSPTFYATAMQAGQTRTVALRVTDNYGDVSEIATTTVLAVDRTPPTVMGVTVNDDWLTRDDVGDGRLAITVTYSKPMSASVAPTIAFTPDVSGVLTSAGGTWTDATHYVAAFDVTGTPLPRTEIGILVSGAQDAAENTQEAFTAAGAFTIYIIETSPALYDPATSTFYLRCENTTGMADCTFAFGEPGKGWEAVVGDWDGDGVSGVGLYDPWTSTFYLTNACTTGCAQYTFGYGQPKAGWLPIAGDWDGDGRSGVGLYDPLTSTFLLTDALVTGAAQYTFGYGQPGAGWKPIVGDWNGDRQADVGLYDPQSGTFYLTDERLAGVAQRMFSFGEPTRRWEPVAGDWNADGRSGVGLYDPRSSTFYLADTFGGGFADCTLGFGQPRAGWTPLAGCWTNTDAQAVDELDLAELAATTLNDLDTSLGNG